MGEQQDIIKAAEEALRQADYHLKTTAKSVRIWTGKGASGQTNQVLIGPTHSPTYAFFDLVVDFSDIPTLLRYKETAKERDALLSRVVYAETEAGRCQDERETARAGADALAQSLAAAHQEIKGWAEEVERLKGFITHMDGRVVCPVCQGKQYKMVLTPSGLCAPAEQVECGGCGGEGMVPAVPKAERDLLAKEVEYLRQRERDICQAVPMVSDNGKYREDIISAVGGVVERNIRLTKEVETLKALLNELEQGLIGGMTDDVVQRIADSYGPAAKLCMMGQKIRRALHGGGNGE